MLLAFAGSTAVPHDPVSRSLTSLRGDYGVQDSRRVIGSSTETNLTQAQRDHFLAEIAQTLQEIQSCAAANSKFINISSINSAQIRVESGQEDEYTLACTFTSNSSSTVLASSVASASHDVEVELITFGKDDEYVVAKITPYDFFAACVQELIEEEAASGLSATAASTEAEESIEGSESFVALPHLNVDGPSNQRRLQAALYRPPSALADFAEGGRFERHALGYIQEEHSAPVGVRPRNVTTLMKSLPTRFDPFVNTTCLEKFPARDQGTCGSCYAFAASSAASLSYCLKAAAKGITPPETLVFSAQTMVSCGSRMSVAEGKIRVKMNSDSWTGITNFRSQAYNNACNGGGGVSSFKFQEDFGFPWTSCYPYASGGGDPIQHFDAAQGETPECHEKCTGSSTYGQPMETFTGLIQASSTQPSIEACRGEAAIMDCMVRLGPLFCAMEVWTDFSNYDTHSVYDGPDDSATLRGAHAVVCFGWDVTESGSAYWRCLNSWGSWGEHRRGEFYLRKGSDTATVPTLGEVWGKIGGEVGGKLGKDIGNQALGSEVGSSIGGAVGGALDTVLGDGARKMAEDAAREEASKRGHGPAAMRNASSTVRLLWSPKDCDVSISIAGAGGEKSGASCYSAPATVVVTGADADSVVVWDTETGICGAGELYVHYVKGRAATMTAGAGALKHAYRSCAFDSLPVSGTGCQAFSGMGCLDGCGREQWEVARAGSSC